MRHVKDFKFCLNTPDLAQVLLHPWISSFQLSSYLAHHQPWIWINLHRSSTHLLDHHHSYRQSFILCFVVRSRETQPQRFLNGIFSGDTRTSPTPDPRWLVALSTYTSQSVEHWTEIMPTDFSFMPCFSIFISSVHSTNSATRSTRTCHFIEVRDMYFISKAPRIGPHLAILPV